MEDGARTVPPFPSIRIPGAWGRALRAAYAALNGFPFACITHIPGADDGRISTELILS